MPAKDKYHETVKRALVKDGWAITGEQVAVRIGRRQFWIDLRAAKNGVDLVVLIEVKGFETSLSQATLLMEAIGQYRLYRMILATSSDRTPLYLAVPVAAYNGILSEPVGDQAIQDNQMKLIVFDPKTEALVKWIPKP
jgi:hypothetical protein